MNYSSKDTAIAAAVPDNLQFTHDTRRHHLQIHAHKFNVANRYDLTSFTITVTTGALREFGLSLATIGRLLSRVDMDGLSHKTEQLEPGEIDNLIILVPQHDDYDEYFPTTVNSWDEVRHFGRDENLSSIPYSIGDLLKTKIRGDC